MLYLYHESRTTCFTAVMIILVLLSVRVESKSFAEESDFLKRHEQIKERFEKRRDKPKNKLIHDPPMIESADSSLDDDEAVIGVYLNGESRAYPLTMLYGGGIFELLNDTCGDQPIAVSW